MIYYPKLLKNTWRRKFWLGSALVLTSRHGYSLNIQKISKLDLNVQEISKLDLNVMLSMPACKNANVITGLTVDIIEKIIRKS